MVQHTVGIDGYEARFNRAQDATILAWDIVGDRAIWLVAGVVKAAHKAPTVQGRSGELEPALAQLR